MKKWYKASGIRHLLFLILFLGILQFPTVSQAAKGDYWDYDDFCGIEGDQGTFTITGYVGNLNVTEIVIPAEI